MSIKKNKNQLIISILVGIAIFAVTYQFVIRQHQENLRQKEEIAKLKSGIGVTAPVNDENTTIYVVAKVDIPKDHTITNDDVELKDLGMKTKGVFTDLKTVIGAKTTKEIEAGHPVAKNSLDVVVSETTSLDEPRAGYRAVAATVAANRMAPFIEDGAYIDIYTANNTIQATNVRVLKILDSGGKSNKLILFEIKEEDVGPFIYGMTEDKLIPVQKNKNDKTEYSFAYDPFKYSSYTVSNEDMTDGFNSSEIPQDGGGNYYVPVSSTNKTESVEVIQGSKKETLDF